jgi:hypothetical protein
MRPPKWVLRWTRPYQPLASVLLINSDGTRGPGWHLSAGQRLEVTPKEVVIEVKAQPVEVTSKIT